MIHYCLTNVLVVHIVTVSRAVYFVVVASTLSVYVLENKAPTPAVLNRAHALPKLGSTLLCEMVTVGPASASNTTAWFILKNNPKPTSTPPTFQVELASPACSSDIVHQESSSMLV